MSRFDPFRELERMFDEDWVPMFPAVRRRMEPAADISETDTEVIAEFDLPGVDPKKVEIMIEDDLLTISGGQESEQEEKGKNFYRREIRRGQFSRSVQLPTAVKSEQAKAEYRNGMLKVTVPKTQPKEKSKVNIEIK